MLVLSLFCLLPLGLAQIQVEGQLPETAAGYAQDVVDVFETAYSAYLKYAITHDNLLAVSESYIDDRNGWQATVWDALDTMQIMGLTDLYNQALNLTSTTDFSHSVTSDAVDVFESVIRYLGGAISTYELTGKTEQRLIDQVKVLTDNIAYAFVGPIPYNEVDFSTSPPSPQTGVSNIAQAGTLTLEFSRLSIYTGNDTYRQLAENAVKAMIPLSGALPHIPAQDIDPSTGELVGDYISWGGGSDSYLEYLIKYARLTNNADPTFLNAWQLAVDTSIQYLLKYSTVGNWTYLTDYSAGQNIFVGSHLECFHGGNWILGGKLLNNATIFNYGLALVDACFNTYHSTPTGLGPEVFGYITSSGNYSGYTITPEDLTFNEEHGFYVTGNDYYLRPEVLESNFYAWRATGDLKYFNNAVSAFNSIKTYLKAPAGYAGINDVTVTNSSMIDEAESFFYAETLKYLYLTFSSFDTISIDHYVFNTEAHPYAAPTWTYKA